MKIFILDFSNNDTFLHHFKNKNYTIIFEKNDGGKAYKTVAEEIPLMIFVHFNHKPSHCLQTITAIKNRKLTSQIPVYFVDGDAENLKKADKLGYCISSQSINKILHPI